LQVFVVVLHFGFPPVQSPSPRHWTHWSVDVLQRGVGSEQFASLEHPEVHVSLEVLQIPSAPVVHCAFEVHCTHWFVVVLQTGRPGVHAVMFVPLHCTHAPEGRQAGVVGEVHAAVAPEPKSPLQGTHTPAPALHTGVVPTHALGSCAVHCTHVSVVPLHTLVMPVHATVSAGVHWTHTPVPRSQAGNVVVGHAALAPLPLSPLQGTHVPDGLHTGVAPLQSAELWHCTQVSPGEQNGVGAEHCPFVRHCTHWPVGLHFGVAPPHWASVTQVDVHVSVAGLQNGVGAEHCAFVRHWTHRSVAVLHTGIGAMHAAASVPLHCTHWPATHAGNTVVGHAADAPDPLSPLHGTHTLPAHTGALPGHWADVTHATQRSVARLQ
jgi:hypothetical protein